MDDVVSVCSFQCISGDTGEVTTLVSIHTPLPADSIPRLHSGRGALKLKGSQSMQLLMGGSEAGTALRHPIGIAFDKKRQRLIVGDSYSHCIRAVDIRTGELCRHDFLEGLR